MHEIRLKLIKKVSFSRISCIFRDFPRDGESDAWEDCRCKMSQKNGEHHHVYRQKDNVAYSFHIAFILYIVIRLQIYKKYVNQTMERQKITLFQHFFLDFFIFHMYNRYKVKWCKDDGLWGGRSFLLSRQQ